MSDFADAIFSGNLNTEKLSSNKLDVQCTCLKSDRMDVRHRLSYPDVDPLIQ